MSSPASAPAGGNSAGPPIPVLAAIAAIGPAAITLFIPALPAIGLAFSVTADVVQWTLTVYFLGISFGQLFYGPLSDRFGRKPVLIGGVCIYTAASLVAFAANSIEMLIVARAFQALGGCSGMVTVRAMIQDAYSGDKVATALSTVLMASSVAPMTAPLLGGYLVEWFGWRAGFLLLTAAGLLLIWRCLASLHETQRDERPVANGLQLAGLYGQVMARRNFMVFAVGYALLPSSHFAFMSGAPHYAIGAMHCTPSQYGFLSMAIPAGFIAGNFITTRLTPRLGGSRMVGLGMAVGALGLLTTLTLTALHPNEPLFLFAPTALLTLGHGMSLSNLVAITLRHATGLTGTAVAAMGAMQMGMAALMSRIVGNLLEMPVTAMLLVMMTAHALSALLVMIGHRRAS